MKQLFILLALLLNSGILMAQSEKVDTFIKKGIELHDQGQYKAAIKQYKKALEIDSDNSLANYEIAHSYMSLKDYKKAESYSKKVIKAKDESALAGYIVYGSALDMQGKTKKSIAAYEEAMKNHEHYLLYYNHAISCFNLEKDDKAYKSTLKAIDLNSSHASSHLLLSQIMDAKGSRIKTILPLYFFLLIEPTGPRAEVAYKSLIKHQNSGVDKTSENNINISIPSGDNGDEFSAAEMMLSLTSASRHLEENENKSELELFAMSNKTIFSILGGFKNENTGFWWDFYVTFFYEMEQKELTEFYSYYISQAQDEEAVKWLEKHESDFEKFKNFMNQ